MTRRKVALAEEAWADIPDTDELSTSHRRSKRNRTVKEQEDACIDIEDDDGLPTSHRTSKRNKLVDFTSSSGTRIKITRTASGGTDINIKSSGGTSIISSSAFGGGGSSTIIAGAVKIVTSRNSTQIIDVAQDGFFGATRWLGSQCNGIAMGHGIVVQHVRGKFGV